MKFLNMNTGWEFSEDPFPAWRLELVFGRWKRDFSFLPVKDVNIDTIVDDDNDVQIMADDSFRVIKTKAKGTIMVVPLPPGDDPQSHRLFAFTDVGAGFRGCCGIREADTTAVILKTCRAHGSCRGRVSTAAVYDPGQRVVYYSNGRGVDDIIIYEWTGDELVHTIMTRLEYEACSCVDEAGAEVL